MTALRVDSDTVSSAVARLFVAHGSSADNARAVAEHLVDSERLNLPSHGLIRVRQYLREISTGLLDPAAEPTVDYERDTVAHIDGHLGFGQVAGLAAARVAEEKASQYGTAFVTVRNVQHTGRLGAYTEEVAARGYIVLAFGSGAPRFHRVVPFGGRDGRLSTNPIAWAAPMQDSVMSADFSTSAIPEGRVRVMQAAGRPAPSETICDAEGRPTTDTTLFYGDPSRGIEPGALLPLGGSQFGHKGYALGLLSESLATVLAGDRPDSATSRANNLAIIAIKGDAELADRMSATAAYMKSSRPSDSGRDVMTPGEPERRNYARRGALEIPDYIWTPIVQALNDVGIDQPECVVD